MFCQFQDLRLHTLHKRPPDVGTEISSTCSFGTCCSFKFPSQVDKTSESKECPNIFCFSDFCFPNTFFFPNKTSQRITPKIRRLHHEPTCWVKTAGFLLPKVCHGLRRRVFFQHFPNRRQCETDTGRCMADIFTSPQNTVDPKQSPVNWWNERSRCDRPWRWWPKVGAGPFFLPEKVGKEYRVACHWWCPLSNPILTHFLRSNISIHNPVKLLFPTYQSLFSKLHVLHRKGPTLSTSTRAPVFHWSAEASLEFWVFPHLHGQVRRQSAVNEGQRCGQAAAHRYPTKEGHPWEKGEKPTPFERDQDEWKWRI